jgi:hypothetical protein
MGGVQVLVRDEDAQRALEILNPPPTTSDSPLVR